jgi:mRNA interferase MazF
MSSNPQSPLRGEVWDMSLDPTLGGEQAGTRPCVVVSNDNLNRSGSDTIIVVPISRTQRPVISHIPVEPPEGGLTSPSYIKCEHVRSVSRSRLIHRRGSINRTTMQAVEQALRRLLAMNP